MGPGTTALAVALERVDVHPVQRPYLVHPRPWGHALWAAALEGSSLTLLPIPSCHPSVPQSLCGLPPAPDEILVFTGRSWSQLRSRSPGALPSPGGSGFGPLCAGTKGSWAGMGRGQRPSRCLSLSWQPAWGVTGGVGVASFTSRAGDKAP